MFNSWSLMLFGQTISASAMAFEDPLPTIFSSPFLFSLIFLFFFTCYVWVLVGKCIKLIKNNKCTSAFSRAFRSFRFHLASLLKQNLLRYIYMLFHLTEQILKCIQMKPLVSAEYTVEMLKAKQQFFQFRI